MQKGLRSNFVTLCFYVAEGQGFEPWLTGPEPVVLPLDDPSQVLTIYIKGSSSSITKLTIAWINPFQT